MTGGNGSTAKYGTSSGSVTSSWTSPTSTKVKAQYFLNLTTTQNGSVTLVANWTANTYTIEYYQGNNINSEQATLIGTSSHTYGTAKNLSLYSTFSSSLPSSKPNGTWTFAGWTLNTPTLTLKYTDGQSVSNLTSTNGGTIKLYALFKRNILFISGVNVATVKQALQYYNPYRTIGYLSNVTVPTLTTISGWTAEGYGISDLTDQVSLEVGNQITPAYNANQATITFYGVYSKPYTVNFYSGVSKGTNNALSGNAIYNTGTETLPTTVSITLKTANDSTNISNWTENGWRNDTTASVREYTYGQTNVSVPIGTSSFYSIYTRNLTIQYNGNGNTGGSTLNSIKTVYLNADSTTTSAQSVTTSLNRFTKTGYTAKSPEWNTSANGSGTAVASLATYTVDPKIAYNASSFTKTLYAQWQANKALITIRKDNADWTDNISPRVALYQDGSSKYAYDEGTKSGAIISWDEVAAGTYDVYASRSNVELATLVDTGIDVVVTNTGTATIDYYTLTLNKGVGISLVIGSGTYLKNQPINIDATVSNGYTWEGWSVISGNTPN
jgi:hypothetical protein